MNGSKLVTVSMFAAMASALFLTGQGRENPPALLASVVERSSLHASASPSIGGEPLPRSTVLTVTSPNDDGPGSLRRAIEDAHAASTSDSELVKIVFDIPGEGPHSIVLYSPLPTLVKSVTLDGYTQPGASPNTLDVGNDARVMIELDGARAGEADGIVLKAGSSTVRGLAVHGFSGDGIRILGGAGHRIEGNAIGGILGSDVQRGNEGNGIAIINSPSNVIGGATPASRNRISFNSRSGVWISGEVAYANTISGNEIVSNEHKGIELEAHSPLPAGIRGFGPNRQQNSPVLSRVTRLENADATGARIEGTLESTSNSKFRLEFYSTRPPRGEKDDRVIAGLAAVSRKEGGRLLTGTDVTTDESGRVSFVLVLPTGVDSRALVTATATDADGNTSEFSSPVQAPTVVRVWNNPAGGNWNVPTNWTPNGAPNPTDDAQIVLDGTYTVTVNVTTQVVNLAVGGTSGVQTLSIGAPTLTIDGTGTFNAAAVLRQTGGTITGGGAITINGTYDWSAGTESGSGSTTVNGALVFTTTNYKDLNGRTLNNTNSATWAASAVDWGVRLGNGAVINNTGVWDVQQDGTLSNPFGGSATFMNSGTFKKTGGTQPSSVSITFNNSGNVTAQIGTISFQGGGTQSGSFNGSGGLVQFAGGAHDLGAGTNLTGAVQLTAGSLNVNSSMTAQTFTLSGGALNVNSPFGVQSFNHFGGSLQGAGTLTTTGLYTWSCGTATGSGTTTANGGIMFTSTCYKDTNGPRTLNNVGTAIWSASAQDWSVRLGNGAVINNTGVWDLQQDGSMSNNVGGSATFLNSGTFKKTGGTGLSNVGIELVNTGSVTAQSGTLALQVGSSHNGSFNGSGGTLKFAGGTHSLAAGASLTGLVELSTGSLNVNSSTSAQTFNLSGGTLNVNSPFGVQNFNHFGGSLQGGGTLTTSGLYTWTCGTAAGPGVTTANGGIVFGSTCYKDTNGPRTLNNVGTAIWSASAQDWSVRLGNGAVINNTGVWDLQHDGSISNPFGGGATFINSGTFKKTGGTGTSNVSIPYTNTGTVEVQTGVLNVSNSSYTQTAGVTRLTGGALSSTTNVDVRGGSLAGSGTITAPVVVSGTGALAPGLSSGLLRITGNYTQQSPNGAFNLEIGGLLPGTQFDRVDVTGSGHVATLAGPLNLTLINGFTPNPGDSFTVMTYPSHTGTFVPNLPVGSCLGWYLDYGATSLVLTAADVPVEITGLTLLEDKISVVWDAAPQYAGTVYDVLRGDVGTLPVGPGAGESCLASGITTNTATDISVPNAGRCYWYVVRERVTGCGTSGYGFASDGTERVSSACP